MCGFSRGRASSQLLPECTNLREFDHKQSTAVTCGGYGGLRRAIRTTRECQSLAGVSRRSLRSCINSFWCIFVCDLVIVDSSL